MMYKPNKENQAMQKGERRQRLHENQNNVGNDKKESWNNKNQ